jgi:hypothetical protein
MTPRSVWHRVYADFFMPSRLGTYRHLLRTAMGAGYAIVSIERLWELMQTRAIEPGARYLVLRHDIDTDPRTGRAMWAIEQAEGAEGSYFFRLSTVDLDLIARIGAAGGHVGYHYEELALVAKDRRLRTRAEALRYVPEAQERFARNLERLRDTTGQTMRVVAAHGDFVNRALGVPNWVILTDPDFRREAGVDLETYDEAFMSHVTSRHSDTHYPRFWIPAGPAAAIAAGEPIVYLLVHPRHWKVARTVNARDDLGRLVESVMYRRPTRTDPAAGVQ